MDDKKTFAVQIRHLRSCISSLRLFDLAELERSAEQFGTDEERDLIAAVLLALETLPDDPH